MHIPRNHFWNGHQWLPNVGAVSPDGKYTWNGYHWTPKSKAVNNFLVIFLVGILFIPAMFLMAFIVELLNMAVK